MTPGQMRREEQHGQLMAVAHALTEAERQQFLASAFASYPRLRGAEVADVLDLTTDHDMFLDKTEAFFTKFGAQMPDDVHYAPLYAAHVLIILGRPLTVSGVRSLLERAGVIDGDGYDPARDLAEVLAYVHRTGTPSGGEASQALDNLREHLDLSTVEAAEASLRALYGRKP